MNEGCKFNCNPLVKETKNNRLINIVTN